MRVKYKIKLDQTFLEIKRGNIKVFENMFREYYQGLCAYSMKYVKDIDKAQELVQDVFYNIWKKRDELNVTSSLKSYIYRSVYNKSLQYLQHQNIERKYEQYIKTSNVNYPTNPLEEVNAKELDTLIKSTYEAMPEKTRTIFNMSRVEGLKYHEIAEKLSVSVKTVEAYMGKALKLFRSSLKEYMSYSSLLLWLFFN